MASTSRNKSSPRLVLPAPTDSAGFLTVQDSVGSPTATPGFKAGAQLGLQALKDVLEAVDTLPCVKYIAGVGVKILEVVDEIQTTKEAFRNIALRAKDYVLAVAMACEGAEKEVEGQLEHDLSQLIGTMNDILSYTKDVAARKTYKKLLYKMEDAAAADALETQLTHAFQLFQIQSSVGLRISTQKMIRDSAAGSSPPAPRLPPLVLNCPLRVPEGLYLIRNAVEDRVVEVEHRRLTTGRRNVHAYSTPTRPGPVSPQQLWTIYSRSGKEGMYTIRNFATGAVLDVFCGRPKSGTKVIGHSDYGKPNQTWAFYGTRQAPDFDYCTIRSYGPPTVMEGKCPAGLDCDFLHMTQLPQEGAHPAQEWQFVRFPDPSLPPQPTQSPSPSQRPPSTFLQRRKYCLQNVSSDRYALATGVEDGMDDPNVCTTSSLREATRWHFAYTTKDPEWPRFDDMWALVVGDPRSGQGTLDHFGQRHICASTERFWPSDRHHMWKAVPRDGAFSFKNLMSGRLLCQGRMAGVVDTAPPTAFDNPSCMWRLVDPDSGDVCRVLYDATASFLPPDLAGTPVESEAEPAGIQMLALRTETASEELRQQVYRHMEYRYDLMREMLKSGYTSLIVTPWRLSGWRMGQICHVQQQDEETALGLPKFRGRNDYEACTHF